MFLYMLRAMYSYSHYAILSFSIYVLTVLFATGATMMRKRSCLITFLAFNKSEVTNCKCSIYRWTELKGY